MITRLFAVAVLSFAVSSPAVAGHHHVFPFWPSHHHTHVYVAPVYPAPVYVAPAAPVVVYRPAYVVPAPVVYGPPVPVYGYSYHALHPWYGHAEVDIDWDDDGYEIEVDFDD